MHFHHQHEENTRTTREKHCCRCNPDRASIYVLVRPGTRKSTLLCLISRVATCAGTLTIVRRVAGRVGCYSSLASGTRAKEKSPMQLCKTLSELPTVQLFLVGFIFRTSDAIFLYLGLILLNGSRLSIMQLLPKAFFYSHYMCLAFSTREACMSGVPPFKESYSLRYILLVANMDTSKH
jgi:hypothetical protein